MNNKKLWYALYSCTAKWLPVSWRMRSAKKIRGFMARKVLKSAGENINIERGACFTTGTSIGSNSSIGINCHIQAGDVTIGDNVLMGPDILIYTTNHETKSIDIPICQQGDTTPKPVVIEDDVWIGARAIILPGVTIAHGSVVGGYCRDKIFSSLFRDMWKSRKMCEG